MRIEATESEEQTILFQWAEMEKGRYPELALMFHIPNEGLRSYVTGECLKRQGMKKGVPDIFLPCRRGLWNGLFIEMKRRKGGTLSAEQAEWLRKLNDAGYAAVWCRGFDAARATILRYLQEGTVTVMTGRGIGAKLESR